MTSPKPRVSDRDILEAAGRVLDKNGWKDLTAERIAAEAGVSRVTLHRRGWTRGAVLGALAAAAEGRYREYMWPVLTMEGSARERLALALKTICDLAEENLSLMLALDAEANASVFHEPSGDADLTRSVFTEPLERLLRDGVSDGSLREVAQAETATVLFNMVGWTYIHLRAGHRWAADRASRVTIETVLTGVAL